MSPSVNRVTGRPVSACAAPALFALLGAALAAPAYAGGSAFPPPSTPPDVITFDDFPSAPGVTGNDDVKFANNNNSVFDGVTFSGGWAVVGSQWQYLNDGIPFLDTHSGDYAASFDYGDPQSLTTTKTLYGFWAGRVDYRDAVGQGDDRLLVSALGANGAVLGSVNATFQTKKPTFIDTSAFAKLSGITGYEFTPDSADFPNAPTVGVDDLTFSPASNPVPEASTTLSFGLLLALGLGGMGLAARKKAAQKKDAA